MPERAGHGTRDPTDYYATTPELAALIARKVREDFHESIPSAPLILEPGCGAGTFLRALRETWPRASLHGVEVHEDLAAFSREKGFEVSLSDLLKAHWGKVDLIIGNPPFRLSEAFVHHLRDHLKEEGVLVLLLRLNFMAGQDRFASLWQRYKPAKLYVLPARPGFSPDGKTDATDYGVFVWRKESSLTMEVEWLDNRDVMNAWRGSEPYPDPRKRANAEPVSLVKDEPTRVTTRERGN